MRRDDLLELPPYRAVESERVHYGRYRHPIPRPNITSPTRLGRLRLKEWHYTSLATDRFFLAFGLVQLGYLANAFCYLVERPLGTCWEYEALSPAGLGLRFAPSSVLGLTSFRLGRARIEAGWDQGWGISLSVPLAGGRVEASFHVEPRESLALLHELPGGRPAYTHKAAALPARGWLRWRGVQHRFEDGLACLDWTRAVALRRTTWKWASLAARLDDGRTFGLNLSAEVYDDEQGDSRENALWVDGRVDVLEGASFELPRDPVKEPWVIRSRQGDQLDLVFHPLGARRQQVDAKLIRSDFIQPYGTFSGRIRSRSGELFELSDAFGVVEDHLSVW